MTLASAIIANLPHIAHRPPETDQIIVRLADEGVPAAALARTFRRPVSDIWSILNRAHTAGELILLPGSDWRPGERRGERAPTVAPPRMRDAAALAPLVQRVFGFTPSEAQFLTLLLSRREVTRGSLAALICRPDTHYPDRVLNVHMNRMRRKLEPHGIGIETIMGYGYALRSEDADAILARIDAFHQAEMDLQGRAA